VLLVRQGECERVTGPGVNANVAEFYRSNSRRDGMLEATGRKYRSLDVRSFHFGGRTRASPNTPDFQTTFSRPQFSEEEVRKFFAPVLDDDEPMSEPDEPPSRRAAESTAEGH
jgi:hypothetical protein